MNTLIHCSAFIAFVFINWSNDKEKEQTNPKINNIEKFMLIENVCPISRSNINYINLNDFTKYLGKIIKNMSHDYHIEIIEEILKDFSFSNILYEKFEEFINKFFNNK
jgi:hypothetical protein